MFSIEVTSPKGQKEKVDCAIDSCSIGKGDDNLIVVRGWSVGKKHATIRQRPDGFYLEDHGAIGGTEVNGKNIDGTYGPLKPDDSILIGGYSICVQQGGMSGNGADSSPVVAPAAAAPRQEDPPRAAAPAAPAPAPAKAAPAAPAAVTPTAKAIQEINVARNKVHQKLIQAMDLRRLDVSRMAEKELRDTTKTMIDE